MTTSSLIQESTTIANALMNATATVNLLGHKVVDTAVFLFTGAGSPLRARRVIRRVGELLGHVNDITAQQEKLDRHISEVKSVLPEKQMLQLGALAKSLQMLRLTALRRTEALAMYGLGQIYAFRLTQQARAGGPKTDLKLTPRADLFCADEKINALLTDLYDAQLQAAVATLDTWMPIYDALENL